MRAIWLCEELELPYQITPVDFSAQYRASPEWRALNPVGKVPVLTDDSVTMFESGAMVQYILARYGNGQLAPAVDHPTYPQYLQWSWFAEATLARPAGEIVNHRRAFPGPEEIPAVLQEMQERVGLSVEAVAQTVSQTPYLLGDEFSAADIMMGYSLHIAEMVASEFMPNTIQPYWQSLKSRPGFKIAAAA